ncbi:MAG: hypothetical protein EB051_02415 [Chlamydiia bacterium]|nr:hypothetical protein [Chlamydiia bacterium]
MAAVATSNAHINRSWSHAANDFQKAYSKGIKDPGLIGNLFKVMDLSAFWITFYNPDAAGSVSDLAFLGKYGKLVTSAANLPARIDAFFQAIYNPKKLGESNAKTESQQQAEAGAALIATVKDVVELAAKFFVAVPSSALVVLKAASSFSLVVNSGTNLINAVRSPNGSHGADAFLELMQQASSLAMGLLGLASLATPIAPYRIIAVATVSTGLSLVKHFQKNMEGSDSAQRGTDLAVLIGVPDDVDHTGSDER